MNFTFSFNLDEGDGSAGGSSSMDCSEVCAAAGGNTSSEKTEYAIIEVPPLASGPGSCSSNPYADMFAGCSAVETPTGPLLRVPLLKQGPATSGSSSSGSTSSSSASSSSMGMEQPSSSATATATADDLGYGATDLVPGQYEGGLKTWECAVDLCRYLGRARARARRQGGGGGGGGGEEGAVSEGDNVDVSGLSVLELGCGSGLPGIYALRHLGARSAAFVDFNANVIEEVTWPNIYLNMSAGTGSAAGTVGTGGHGRSMQELVSLGAVRCFAGNWMGLSRLLQEEQGSANGQQQRYDVILTSETLYNGECCQQVAELLLEHLQFPSGVAYIASKRYYFGVGGGTAEFMATMERLCGAGVGGGEGGHTYRGVTQVVDVLENKLSNIREIIKFSYVRM